MLQDFSFSRSFKKQKKITTECACLHIHFLLTYFLPIVLYFKFDFNHWSKSAIFHLLFLLFSYMHSHTITTYLLKESWCRKKSVKWLTCLPGADVVWCAGLMFQLSLHKLAHGQSSQRASLHLTVLSWRSDRKAITGLTYLLRPIQQYQQVCVATWK